MNQDQKTSLADPKKANNQGQPAADLSEVNRGPVILEWQTEDREREYGPEWIIKMVAVLVILAVASWFLQQSISFIVLLVVLGVIMVIYVRRPRQKIHYTLHKKGLQIDRQYFNFDEFKSFGLQENSGNKFTLVILPKKRFSPALIVDFLEADGKKIVDFFGGIMPMQKVEPTFIDKIVEYIGL